MDGVAQQSHIRIEHPAVDENHPDHKRLVERLANSLAEFGLAVAIDVVTHGVIRIGPLSDRNRR